MAQHINTRQGERIFTLELTESEVAAVTAQLNPGYFGSLDNPDAQRVFQLLDNLLDPPF